MRTHSMLPVILFVAFPLIGCSGNPTNTNKEKEPAQKAIEVPSEEADIKTELSKLAPDD